MVISTSRAGKPDALQVQRLGAKTGQQQGPPARPSRSESEQLPEPIGGRRADGVRLTQDRVCSEERRGRHGRTDLHRNRRCQGPPRCPRPPEWRGVAVGERPRRHRRTRGAGDDARPGAGRAGGVGEVRGPVCCGPRGGRGTCGRREPAAGPGLREVDRPARQDRHARRGHARALRRAGAAGAEAAPGRRIPGSGRGPGTPSPTHHDDGGGEEPGARRGAVGRQEHRAPCPWGGGSTSGGWSASSRAWTAT